MLHIFRRYIAQKKGVRYIWIKKISGTCRHVIMNASIKLLSDSMEKNKHIIYMNYFTQRFLLEGYLSTSFFLNKNKLLKVKFEPIFAIVETFQPLNEIFF